MARTDKGAGRTGGTWSGVKPLRREFNRRDRAKAKQALRREGDAPSVQPRGRAKWELY